MVSADGLSKFSVKKWRFLSVFCNSLSRNGDFRQFFAILRREIEISVGFLQFSVEKRRFPSVFCNSPWKNGDFHQFRIGERFIFLTLWNKSFSLKGGCPKGRRTFILSFALLRKTGLFSSMSFPRDFADLGREEFLIFSFLCW